MSNETNNAHLAIVGLSFLAIGATLGLFFSGNLNLGDAGGANIIEADQQQEETQAYEFVAVSADDDAYLGDEDAPITIVEFSDFQCPYCAKFVTETLPQIKEAYIDTGMVKFVYRDFPLGSHPNAQVAAEAAECVGETGNEEYFAMHDLIFEKMNEWSYTEDPSAYFISLASSQGHDIQTCMEEGEMTAEVTADFTAARGYGVTGTPTLFVNGKKIVGAYPFEVFQSLIEAELEAL